MTRVVWRLPPPAPPGSTRRRVRRRPAAARCCSRRRRGTNPDDPAATLRPRPLHHTTRRSRPGGRTPLTEDRRTRHSPPCRSKRRVNPAHEHAPDSPAAARLRAPVMGNGIAGTAVAERHGIRQHHGGMERGPHGLRLLDRRPRLRRWRAGELDKLSPAGRRAGELDKLSQADVEGANSTNCLRRTLGGEALRLGLRLRA